MRILSPVRNAEEVKAVSEAGADEVYCGFLPADWKGVYSNVASPNRREWKSANILGQASLEAVLQQAHQSGVRVFLALNALYTKEQYPLLLRQIDVFEKLKPDALIVADTGLLSFLRKKHPHIEIHVSTGGTVFNAAAALFYRDLGVKRIVFPRHIRIEEAARIVQQCPGVEFEMFVLNSGCKNIDGFCTFQHGIQELTRKGAWELPKKWHWDYFLLETLRMLPDRILKKIRTNMFGIDSACLIDFSVAPAAGSSFKNDRARKAALENIASSFHLYSGMDPCGACRIAEMKAIGISGIKIVGRNHLLTKKVKDVVFLKKALSLAGSGGTREGNEVRIRALYKEIYHKDCKGLCYYSHEDHTH